MRRLLIGWLALVLLLAGCGSDPVRQYLDGHLTLVELRPSAYTSEEARVYESTEPVPAVAEALAAVRAPAYRTTPPREDRMVLVYPDWVADIYRDPAARTRVIWQSRQFVRDHYEAGAGPDGYFGDSLAEELIDELFEGRRSYKGTPTVIIRRYDDDSYWRQRAAERRASSGGTGSVRTGSTTGPRFSGGGTGAGK
ncbi:MAG: DUF4247 domain-containing protein [Bacillota bacterium]